MNLLEASPHSVLVLLRSSLFAPRLPTEGRPGANPTLGTVLLSGPAGNKAIHRRHPATFRTDDDCVYPFDGDSQRNVETLGKSDGGG